MRLVINADFSGHCFFPYLDSFSFGNDDRITNYRTGADEYFYEDTGGERQEEGYVTTYDGDRIDEDDAICIDGEFYHRDECRYDDFEDKYILEEDAVHLNDGQTCHVDDAVNVCTNTIDIYVHQSQIG